MPDTRLAMEPRPDTHPLSLSMAYLGHSTVLIDIGGVRVLTDPILRRRVGPLVRAGAPVDPASWSAGGRGAHLAFPLGSPGLRVTPPDRQRRAHRGAAGHGGTPARTRLPARWWRSCRATTSGIAGLTVEATRALHRGFGPPIGPTELCVGYLVRGTRSVYFAGDTALFEGMAAFDRGVELALIPVWGWGPPARAPEHLDPLGAAHAVRLVRPRIAVPIHWGTLHPIGLRRVRPQTRIDPPHEFARLAAEVAPDTIVRVVPIGGSLSLDGELSGP